MLDEIVEHSVAIVGWDWRLTVLTTSLLVFVSTRAITTYQSSKALKATGNGKTPPIVPYSIPIVGNMIDFAFNSMKFLTWMRNTYGPNIIVRFRVVNMKIHYISGIDNVLSLFRGSRDLTTAPSSIIVLEGAFGSPASVRHIMVKDKTGISAQPLPGVEPVEPHNRIFYITHKNIHKHLNGKNLAVLAEKFHSYLDEEIHQIKVGTDGWTEVPDLLKLVQHTVFTASTKALCGPLLFDINPGFATDFWEFDSHVPNLFRLIPRWIIPSAYRVRDKLNLAISRWHELAAEGFDYARESVEPQDWEKFYGHRIMRDRAIDFQNMDGYTDEAKAANDLGMIWGTNANSVPAVAWLLLDILKRPSLLAAIKKEIRVCQTPLSGLDLSRLLSQPLLQSVYSEELRMRAAVAIQRVPVIDNFKLGSYAFPKGQMILTSSWHEHRDKKVWNEGPVRGEMHPVDEFWAERFLVYPDDPSSGPLKPELASRSKIKTQSADTKEKEDNKPIFTTDLMQGSFIPFGGGLNMCPGRFYAKQEIILATATFLDEFEFDFGDGHKGFAAPNMAYFPFGLVPPKGKFPVRMRRRHERHEM